MRFSKTQAKFPLSCNLVTLLENFEDAKTNRNIHLSGDVGSSKLQNFLGEHAPGHPLAGSYLGIAAVSAFFIMESVFSVH